jgi:hypothetical protein
LSAIPPCININSTNFAPDAACISSASNTVAIMQHYDGLLAAVAYSTTRNQHRWTEAI